MSKALTLARLANRYRSKAGSGAANPAKRKHSGPKFIYTSRFVIGT